MYFENVFFDWNGTLYDDAMASVLAVNHMLRDRDRLPITLENYREMIEIPIENFYKKVLDMSLENMDDLSVEFNTLYKKNLPDCPVAPNVKQTLETLSQMGVHMYIFSSSACDIILPHLKKWGMEKYFCTVLGASDCYVTSKTERTAKYIFENNIDPQKTLFVGDMVHDREVAQHVGSECLLVSYGHQSESALKETGMPVISDISCLSHIVKNGF